LLKIFAAIGKRVIYMPSHVVGGEDKSPFFGAGIIPPFNQAEGGE